MSEPVRTSAKARPLAERMTAALNRFLHIEAFSGIALLTTALIALIWANSPAGPAYEHLWHLPVVIGLGSSVFEQSLHFWINDGLMTIFFLLVGLEIRREIHEGALATVKLAALPLIAALGGIIVPALLYSAFNTEGDLHRGWAIPTATDIAFAVGVLALLGKRISSGVRILLLALAVIDDIGAIIIIALFYSGRLEAAGLVYVVGAVLFVLALQRSGFKTAFAYVLPGALLWYGLWKFGVHPTLAGVILGLMTPVKRPEADQPLNIVAQTLAKIKGAASDSERALTAPIRQLRQVEYDVLSPVTRVQSALHGWVAFLIMPLFAFANAGVNIQGADISAPESRSVLLGVMCGLVLGKPIGIFLASMIAARLGICELPRDVGARGVIVVGLLGGIGFTMSVFVANLSFPQHPEWLAAAKLGVLAASTLSALLGLAVGLLLYRRANGAATEPAT